MDRHKANQLGEKGWEVGDAADFLGLSPEEAEYVEFKMALASRVKELRVNKGLTQHQLAREMGSSQSRIAKLEAADASVSADLMLKSLFKLGARWSEIPLLTSPVKQVQYEVRDAAIE